MTTDVQPPRRRRILLVAAAVVAAAVSAAIATRVLDDSTPDEIAAVLDAADAVTVELTGDLGELRVVSSGAESRAVLLGDGIAGLDDGQTYELWAAASAGSAPAPLGTFLPDVDGVVEVVFDDVTVAADARLAVTVEPAGGSGEPTSPPLAESA